jgi:hypothetical protein
MSLFSPLLGCTELAQQGSTAVCEQGKHAEAYAVFAEMREIILARPAIAE